MRVPRIRILMERDDAEQVITMRIGDRVQRYDLSALDRARYARVVDEIRAKAEIDTREAEA